jgi:hypothetical protein
MKSYCPIIRQGGLKIGALADDRQAGRARLLHAAAVALWLSGLGSAGGARMKIISNQHIGDVAIHTESISKCRSLFHSEV